MLKLWSYRSPKGFYDRGIIYRTGKRNDAGTAVSSESVTFSMKTVHPWSDSSTPFALTLPFNLTSQWLKFVGQYQHCAMCYTQDELVGKAVQAHLCLIMLLFLRRNKSLDR